MPPSKSWMRRLTRPRTRSRSRHKGRRRPRREGCSQGSAYLLTLARGLLVMIQHRSLQGAGLGLRRSFLEELAAQAFSVFPDFFEVAPENWMGMGGRYARQLRQFTERHPFVCHGLSLSIGGLAPLDQQFLKDLRVFLDQHQVRVYS